MSKIIKGENMDKTIENLKEQLPVLVKDNKGALVGAAIGYFFSDDPKVQSALLGAIAGAIILDKKEEDEDE